MHTLRIPLHMCVYTNRFLFASSGLRPISVSHAFGLPADDEELVGAMSEPNSHTRETKLPRLKNNIEQLTIARLDTQLEDDYGWACNNR